MKESKNVEVFPGHYLGLQAGGSYVVINTYYAIFLILLLTYTYEVQNWGSYTL